VHTCYKLASNLHFSTLLDVVWGQETMSSSEQICLESPKTSSFNLPFQNKSITEMTFRFYLECIQPSDCLAALGCSRFCARIARCLCRCCIPVPNLWLHYPQTRLANTQPKGCASSRRFQRSNLTCFLDDPRCKKSPGYWLKSGWEHSKVLSSD
jgi:hypothetical protein